MKSELERLVTLKMPASYLGNQFPGLPCANLDMRSIAALERRGLVESLIHKWRAPYDAADRFTVVYRATDAGRAALTTP